MSRRYATKRFSGAQLDAMREGRAAARMQRPAPDYPPVLPSDRVTITIERHDCNQRVVAELRRSRRVDQYRVTIDGQPWRVAGMSAVLAELRKRCPRILAP